MEIGQSSRLKPRVIYDFLKSAPPPTCGTGTAQPFGWMLGSPPGVPGGGITGVLPPPIGGTEMPGSMPAGGQITPLDWESCSLNGRLPVVSFEEGALLPTPGGHALAFGNGERVGGAPGRSCACAIVLDHTAMAATTATPFGVRISVLHNVGHADRLFPLQSR
jgi:hypothetical protein